MTQPKLSVVVPAYDVGEYLPACLDSVLASTLADLEVIVVDDGSPDESGEIADDYASRDPRVRVVHTPNQGLGPARNVGVEHATGRYLAFLDSDDLVPARAYELLVDSLESTGSDIAAGNAWRYIEGKGPVPSWVHAEVFRADRPSTHVREFPELGKDRMAWNKVFRRSFWDAHGYRFPAMRYEDYPVMLRAHLDAATVDVLSDKVYFWRERRGERSITQRSLDLDNVRDRIVSAHMVLDLVQHEARELRRIVHAFLAAVDLVTVAEALAQAADGDLEVIGREAVALARRLEVPSRAVKPFAGLAHRLLKADRPDVLAQLARSRATRSRRALSGLRPVRALAALPLLLPAAARWLPHLAERGFRTTVRDLVVEGGGVPVLRLYAHAPRPLLARLGIRARFVSPGAGASGDVVVGDRAGNGTLLDLRLDVGLGEEPSAVVLESRLGPLSCRSEVEWPSPPAQVRSRRLPDGAVIVLGADPSGALRARRVGRERTAGAAFVGDSLEVEAGDRPAVMLLRPRPSPPLQREVLGGLAIFPIAELVEDPPDDPLSTRAERPLVAPGDGGTTVDLVFAGRPAKTAWGDHVLRVGANATGALVVTHQRADHLERG